MFILRLPPKIVDTLFKQPKYLLVSKMDQILCLPKIAVYNSQGANNTVPDLSRTSKGRLEQTIINSSLLESIYSARTS